ncbi:hypothetical protein EON83_22945 [bacterium]|nr:MAG: hypothetical protein EON83_22945 [bacterium]
MLTVIYASVLERPFKVRDTSLPADVEEEVRAEANERGMSVEELAAFGVLALRLHAEPLDN